MYNLSKQAKLTRVSNAEAAAQTDIESDSVDMTGFDSICFVVAFGAIDGSAVTSVNAEMSDDDASADAFAEMLATGITVADDDDNQLVMLDVHQPLERYVRCVVERATQNAVVDSIVALQYNASVEPVTHDTLTVVGSEWHHAPVEGTA